VQEAKTKLEWLSVSLIQGAEETARRSGTGAKRSITVTLSGEHFSEKLAAST